MLETGLPYDMGSMDEIKNNGATVDMSNINFPGIPPERICKTTFIFLRNTGFDVKLDFSKCDFDTKKKFLLSYLNENIDVTQDEFAISYISILNRMIGTTVVFDCILKEDEVDVFIEHNRELLSKMLTFILSLPVFAMYYFSLNNEAYTTDDIEKCDDDLISENIYHIISKPECISLFEKPIDEITNNHSFTGPKFYTKVFKGENKQLLVATENLPFFSVLHGLCTINTDNWNAMLKDSDDLENIINNCKED